MAGSRRLLRAVEQLERLLPITLAERVVLELQLAPNRMPDASFHNPDVTYLRKLVMFSGLGRQEIAERLGVGTRSLERYLSTNERNHQKAPYMVQYGLERLLIRRAELNRVARAKRAMAARSPQDA